MVVDLVIQALSAPFSITILYLLHKYGEMKLSELLANIGFSKYKSVRKTLMILAKVGLIKIAIKHISPRVKAWKIRITDHGRRVIEGIIKSVSS